MNSVPPDTVEKWSAGFRHGEIGLLDLLFLEELIQQESSHADEEDNQ